MSQYTVTLDSLIKGGYDLGLKNYPIFEESHRQELNQKIIEHFRFRELGIMPPAKFIFFLNRTLNEEMPLINNYYKEQSIEFNPLFNVDSCANKFVIVVTPVIIDDEQSSSVAIDIVFVPLHT